MTIKNAEAVVKQIESGKPNELSAKVAFYGGTTDYNYSKGFLECAKRVEPIIEALRNNWDFLEQVARSLENKNFNGLIQKAEINDRKIQEALKLWEEIKG